MENRPFYYTKGNYFMKMLPEIKKYFNPKYIIQFGIVLPFYVPFKDNTNLTYKLNNNELAHFHFSAITSKDKIYSGAYIEEEFVIENKISRVEMTFITKNSLPESIIQEDDKNDSLTDIFESLLRKLNIVIDSYRIKQQDYDIYNITKEMLDPTILYRVCDGKRFKEINTGLFILHSNKLDKHRDTLLPMDTSTIMDFIDVLDNEINPFTYSIKLKLESQREFKIGDFRNSVITIQTSIESFLSNLYKVFLIDEGIEKGEATKKARDIRFKNLVTHQIEYRIGGDFDLEKSNTVISKWWSNTYLMRNNIVHDGYSPNFTETQSALHSGLDIYPYIVDLLSDTEVASKYPNLVEYIITR
ncbi:hypothetical protein [Halobacillus sp. Nhm2S1]|uniref:hypothetical protein n=1 Tax=Halobacillus sp. Nhm2S1 TaxID=2866716 RepID=UPI001C72C5C3|nr:hypothetical protein [Halobacillus sp. Nhm2S1]MBX0358952.1 hypothetical protein [Halobacillus sp. Nhm2S1]